MNLVDVVNKLHLNKNVEALPEFRAGDTVAVHTLISEGEDATKKRVQIFQGVVIAVKKGRTINGHFRVRKSTGGIGVERVFPFHSPNVAKVEVVQKGKARRAKLYYLRDRDGKSARVAIDYGKTEGAAQ